MRQDLFSPSVALGVAGGVAVAVVLWVTGGDWLAGAVVGVVAVGLGVGYRYRLAAPRSEGEMVPTVHGTTGRVDAIEVFWRPGCPFVGGLGRELDRAGIPYHLRNIREDEHDAEIVRSVTGGNETVPTLIIGPVGLVNPSMPLVRRALEEHAPHLLDTHPDR